ncbi:MAG: aminotransferase class V-fold PLP-dependent enzyme [Candidatus Thorarchaeota archaeon]
MRPIIDPATIDSSFPTLKEMTYLDNAATGIPPISAVNAMRKYLEDQLSAKGTIEDTLNCFKSIKEGLAALLGGTVDSYGFAPNTSVGLNIFAHGINYPKDSNIVVCDIEFPASYVPWQHAARLYNAELRVVRSREGGFLLDDFVEKIDENTKVVAISLVQFGTGYRAEAEKLARAAHDNGAYFVLDIIQAAGWQEINLPRMGVDFAAAQAAKWLIGPIGAGFFYIRKEIMEEIQPRYLGWWGVENMQDYTYSEKKPTSIATKFEVGSPSMIAYIGFKESLDFLLSIPARNRELAALDNADYFRKRLTEIDIPYYDFPEANRSPIVSCWPKNPDQLQKSALKERIHCSVRNGRLRVSPHFYNTRDDMDRLLEKMR